MEWALPLIAATILAFAAVSRRLDGHVDHGADGLHRRRCCSPARRSAGLVDPSPTGETVKVLAEATLAVVLFSDAARIDLRALREEYRLPARLLGIGLPLTIAAGFGAALLLLGGAALARGPRSSPSCSHRPTPRSARRS